MSYYTFLKSFGAVLLLVSCAHIAQKSNTNPLVKPNWQAQNAGLPHSKSLAKVDERDAIRFEIRSGETWANKSGIKTFRTEVNTDTFPPLESENWYKFSIYLPKDFPIEDNRLVLAQWWAKTKVHLGEVHRSPILQLRFAEGTLAILLRRYPKKVTTDDESYIQTRFFEKENFQLGFWHDFVFQIKWSATENGFIKAWLGGKKIIDFKGITENQDEVGPTFKFGLYRDDSPKTYVSYMSGIEIGPSAKSIGVEGSQLAP